MPASIYSMAPLRCTVFGASQVVLPIESIGFSADILQIVHHHSGNNAPTAILVPGANPRMQCSIPFLIAYQTFGFACVKMINLDLIMCKYIDFVRGGAAQHPMFSLVATAYASAQIVGWSVNVDGILMATVEFVYLTPGPLLHPIHLTQNNDLPVFSGSPVLHTLGPVSIGGTVIPGLTSSSGSINPNLVVERLDGDLYPRVAARLQIAPSFHFNHADPNALFQNLGMLGASNGVIAYFRQYDPTTGVVDNDNAIALTMATSRIHPSGVDAHNGAVSTSDITATGIAPDGVTNPIGVNINANVPTVP